jgi:hypothetical protein
MDDPRFFSPPRRKHFPPLSDGYFLQATMPQRIKTALTLHNNNKFLVRGACLLQLYFSPHMTFSMITAQQRLLINSLTTTEM